MRQADLAEKLGVRKQEVSAYVRGQRNMSLLTAVKYAEALYCDVTDLYEFPGLKRKQKETDS
jgi:DNA-binding XRE family transcriptional regulator